MSSANGKASGYHHTYFDAPDIDYHNLKDWPTDEEIDKIAYAAYNEARQLLTKLGVRESVVQLHNSVLSDWPVEPTNTDDAIVGEDEPPAPQETLSLVLSC